MEKAQKLPIPLPAPMLKGDIDHRWIESDPTVERLLMHCVQFRDGKLEWVIATLNIGGRGGRTYATRVSSGALCRVGNGPHVKATVNVRVRKSRLAALGKLIELAKKGEVEANQVRDRISSRRAQGQVMRAQGRHSWTWND